MEDEQLDQLLDQLVQRTGCQFQSDLCFGVRPEVLSQALMSLELERWPAQVWRQAARYLVGKDMPGDALQVRREMVKVLRGKS